MCGMASKKAAHKNTARAGRRKYRPPTPEEIAAHLAELERETREREARALARSQTPEALERTRKLAEGRRLLDQHNAIRDGLIPPPWMKARNKRKAKVETKERKRLGRPPVPRDPIIKVIGNYIGEHGLPVGKGGRPSADALADKVYLACLAQKVQTPEWTVLKQIVGPIFKQAQASTPLTTPETKSRKVGKSESRKSPWGRPESFEPRCCWHSYAPTGG
jgi:hypothetical protein